MIRLLLAVAMLVPVSGPQGQIETLLTPEGQRGMQEVVDQIRGGALGGDAMNATLEPIEPGCVRIVVNRAGLRRSGFTVSPPMTAATGPGSHNFVLVPDDYIARSHSDRLTALLDKSIGPNAWKPWAAGQPFFWMLPGGDFQYAGAWRVLFAGFFLLATLAAGFAFVAAFKPRELE